MAEISYRRHRFPPIVIQHAMRLYLRFTLSYATNLPHIALGFAVALAALASQLTGLKAGESGSVEPRMLIPLSPGIGAHDSRGRLDPDKAPWRGIGKLQMSSLSRRQTCTATLIGPAIVLTAAHCVFNPETHRNFPPESMHFLIGYDGSRYAGHVSASNSKPGPASATTQPAQTQRRAAIGR